MTNNGMTLLVLVPTWLVGTGFTLKLAGAIRVTVVAGLVTIVKLCSLSNALNAAWAVTFVQFAVTNSLGAHLLEPKSEPGT